MSADEQMSSSEQPLSTEQKVDKLIEWFEKKEAEEARQRTSEIANEPSRFRLPKFQMHINKDEVVRWTSAMIFLFGSLLLNWWTKIFVVAQFHSGVIYAVMCMSVLMMAVLLVDRFILRGFDWFETLRNDKNAQSNLLVAIIIGFAICVHAGTGNQSVASGIAKPAESAVEQSDNGGANNRRTPAGQPSLAPGGHSSNNSAAERSSNGGRATETKGQGQGKTERLE